MLELDYYCEFVPVYPEKKCSLGVYAIKFASPLYWLEDSEQITQDCLKENIDELSNYFKGAIDFICTKVTPVAYGDCATSEDEKKYKEFMNQTHIREKQLLITSGIILKDLESFLDYIKKSGKFLDEQWFLDFLDNLNKFSIDPDRE